MKSFNFKDSMKKYILRKDTMNEPGLQRVYNYPIYSRDSRLYSERGFVNIDDGSQRGIQWTCFLTKDNKSYYFDSFVGQPENFLINQLPKPKINLNCEIQHINSKLCGSYCLYFFYLIERMNYYDATLKMYFDKVL